MNAFLSIAKRVSVPDLGGFEECVGELDPVPSIERDVHAAREIGARGTPTIIVDGMLLGSTPDSSGLVARIR